MTHYSMTLKGESDVKKNQIQHHIDIGHTMVNIELLLPNHLLCSNLALLPDDAFLQTLE